MHYKLFLHMHMMDFIIQLAYMDTHISWIHNYFMRFAMWWAVHISQKLRKVFIMQTYGRMDLLIMPLVGGIERASCLPLYHVLWNKMVIPMSFETSFWSLPKVMKYEDQYCLGLVLLEIKRHREKLLTKLIQPQQSTNRENHDFFKFCDSISSPMPTKGIGQ